MCVLLQGLDQLTKLQLDNNQLKIVDNLGHLVRASYRAANFSNTLGFLQPFTSISP